jgi:hypothetical protein
MKSLRITLMAVLIPISSLAFAQSDGAKAFDQLKTLAGTWEGPVMVNPPQAEMASDTRMHIAMRVTSRGNALVHEMKEAGSADDPTKNDHPVTMFYLENHRLMLTHYCDAGNRPRMVAKELPDGKSVEFTFLDLSGGTEYGHMEHALFTIIDANHHTEDWTYLMPGDKPVHAHMDLQRER